MCREVVCNECKKPTFAGCGLHVEQVLAHVPHDKRCDCRERARKAKGEPVVEASLFRRIFGT